MSKAHSEALRRRWSDPAYRAKMQATRQKPNIPELRLRAALWRAVAQTLAQPMNAATRAATLAAALHTETMLVLSHQALQED